VLTSERIAELIGWPRQGRCGRLVFQIEAAAIKVKGEAVTQSVSSPSALAPALQPTVGDERESASHNRRESVIALKRVYDPASNDDGTRFLVERLWPRGLSKAKLRAHAWLKDVGPSTELRKWFSHDPEKWSAFRRRYFRELDARPQAWKPIASAARRGRVTLVYSSHDAQHNNAVALQQYLKKKALRRSVAAGRSGTARRRSRPAR
jgi:uncharacterized protein YeaO (DUF488 family)